MKIDFVKFSGSLPYSSEIFGVYQPLIGWKSSRIENRLLTKIDNKLQDLKSIIDRMTPDYLIEDYSAPDDFPLRNLLSARFNKVTTQPGNYLINHLNEVLRISKYNKNDIIKVITKENIDSILGGQIKERIESYYFDNFYDTGIVKGDNYVNIVNIINQVFEPIIVRESKIGGLLLYLVAQKRYSDIVKLLKGKSVPVPQTKIIDPLDYFDPQKDLRNVSLSPIGIVHLFRQYFFEFDTFLGSPAGHIWLSPGSSVELVEIHTRKSIIEKTLEQSFERVLKSESTITEQDEISEAVKEDNKQDLKLGFAADVNQGWVTGSANASASLDYNTTQQISKETTHKKMRQQTEKLSTEIKKNYKSTFKTITETTDTSSKRYTLNNTTSDLINYELRRKMRQVGVQVQDIGTYLCWQTYVDDPGKNLGLSNLVHIASPAELDGITPIELAEMPKVISSDHTISIKFLPIVDRGNFEVRKDRTYINGLEEDQGGDMYVGNHRINPIQEFQIVSPQSDYILEGVSVVSTNNVFCEISILNLRDSGNVTINLDKVNFNNQNEFPATFKAVWKPNEILQNKITDSNRSATEAYKNKVDQATKQAFVDSVKERINFASGIKSRKFEELREEERIVVYRNLIKSLVDSAKVSNYETNSNSQHVIAEMINTIFDVDKMLYFVAPDWWKPKAFDNKQFNAIGNSLNDSITAWGGANRSGNYYITEESEPAKLGSSLGWLLQLDGDNMRNAFLNAPWVKAVVPIRPGKERAAINWLKNIEGQTGLSDSDLYGGNEPDLQGLTILQALEKLADKIKEKHEKGRVVGKYPNNDEISDDNKVSSTPIDKVYEHGFYPLQGGFKAQTNEPFEIFDQWIEVLPTDQVVAVEVKYDPITGMQVSNE